LSEPSGTIEPDEEPRPNWTVVLAGVAAVAAVSAASLPWPLATASVALGALMLAGADVDARFHLLPDTITFATLVCGIGAAIVLEPFTPWQAGFGALARATGMAAALAAVRFGYAKLRGKEGVGLGDVKLAAGLGAWLPLDHIPICLALATGAALLYALQARLRGSHVERTTALPFGAFLCPTLWLVFYAGVVSA
jgi:leader peptidase (prepilin peptidase)/N-methyltransferase